MDAATRSLDVTVNGELRSVESGSTVASLLDELSQHPRTVVVEYNLDLIKREAYATTLLRQGDRLEIVRFVQGGRG